MIFSVQIKAARALVGLSQNDLADRSEVGIATIKRIEASTQTRGTAESFHRIQEALEHAGIEFIQEEGGKGLGVRLKTPLER